MLQIETKKNVWPSNFKVSPDFIELKTQYSCDIRWNRQHTNCNCFTNAILQYITSYAIGKTVGKRAIVILLEFFSCLNLFLTSEFVDNEKREG